MSSAYSSPSLATLYSQSLGSSDTAVLYTSALAIPSPVLAVLYSLASS